jgi:uncharacterized protein
MPVSYQTPGIYVEEVPSGPRPIQAVGTSTAGFVGTAPNADAHENEVVPLSNWTQFVNAFVPERSASTPLSHAVYGFFLNGGTRCYVVNVGSKSIAGARGKGGLEELARVDEIAIVAAPGAAGTTAYDALLSHCESLKDRVAILAGPEEIEDITAFTKVGTQARARAGSRSRTEADESNGSALRPRQSDGGFGAFYIPWINVLDPLSGERVNVDPCGHIAGVWARSDAMRGVHKAPANEAIRGALDLTYRITKAEQAELNPLGVNCIRFFTTEGIRLYGARTLAAGASEWRYLNVRRLTNMIEESIEESTRWIVFEPNDRTLWKSIRRDVGAFLTRVWRDGALMGATPQEAFFVQCDEETNPPEVVDAGIVVTVVGIAPVKPAEFIVFRIMQSPAGAEIE